MNIINWLFGRKKKKEIVKPDAHIHWAYSPRSNYHRSLKNADKEDDEYKSRKRRQDDDNYLLNPLNPASPLYDHGNDYTPPASNDFNGFDGGSGDGGGASGDWGSGSSDSGSSYDSGGSDSSSSSSSD